MWQTKTNVKNVVLIQFTQKDCVGIVIADENITKNDIIDNMILVIVLYFFLSLSDRKYIIS